jgi:general secretion pathway protein G
MTLKSRARSRGFTLIEMLVVISMILILLSIALPMYNHSILRAREARLHQDLKTLNDSIDHYSLDKGHAPQSIDDLVSSGYIKFIPDDITGSNTWVTDPEDTEHPWDPNQTGIGSVHSGSNELSSRGDAYSSWKF